MPPTIKKKVLFVYHLQLFRSMHLLTTGRGPTNNLSAGIQQLRRRPVLVLSVAHFHDFPHFTTGLFPIDFPLHHYIRYSFYSSGGTAVICSLFRRAAELQIVRLAVYTNYLVTMHLPTAVSPGGKLPFSRMRSCLRLL